MTIIESDIYHSFDPFVAKEFGITASAIYKFIENNKIEDNTIDNFKLIFDYLTINQIRNAIKKLENNGIIKAIFSENKYDRTKFYKKG